MICLCGKFIIFIGNWKLEFSNVTLLLESPNSYLFFYPQQQYSVRRLALVTLVTPQNDDISLHALSTRPVIMSAAKRDRNSWHFYVIRTRLCRFQKSCPLVFTSLIRRLFTDFINSSRYSDFSHPNSKMKTTHCILIALSLCAVASSTAGCKYAVESYTTTDAMIVTEAAFIAQVSAECEDSPSNLYAEVEGRLLVAANAGPNKYQVRNLFTIQL